MAKALTINDIWKLFQETSAQMRENDRKFREMMAESNREFNEKMAESNRKFDEMSAKTDRQIDKVSKQIGALGSRLGEFVEEMVAPACKTLFAQRGIPVHKVSRRVEADLPDGRNMEIDLMVVNTDAVALVEVKSKLTVEDIRDHLTHMGEFKTFFPEYANKRAIGAVAAMVIEDNVRRFAIHQGLFVIEQAGESLRMANAPDFVPKIW